MGSIIHAFPDAARAHIAGKLLNRHSAKEIANAIDILVDLLDMLGGDPDAEDNGDAEAAGDEGDFVWSEWHGRTATGKRAGQEVPNPDHENFWRTEDDEQDNDDSAVDDGPCDEDADREDDGAVMPSYGIDQSAGPVNPWVRQALGLAHGASREMKA